MEAAVLLKNALTGGRITNSLPQPPPKTFQNVVIHRWMVSQVRKVMKQNGRFIFYHRTTAEDARSIVESGFRNSSGYFLNNRIWTGVWLSSIPVDNEHGAEGDALLTVKVETDEHELARWEWAGEGRTYREWLIPANIINRCAVI